MKTIIGRLQTLALIAAFVSLLLVNYKTQAETNSNTSQALSATATQALSLVKEQSALLVDVRSAEEFDLAHLQGAINIPHDQVEGQLAKFGTDKTRPIVVYCRSGKRAGLAQEALIKHGYSKVFNAGGYADLKDSFQ